MKLVRGGVSERENVGERERERERGEVSVQKEGWEVGIMFF